MWSVADSIRASVLVREADAFLRGYESMVAEMTAQLIAETYDYLAGAQ